MIPILSGNLSVDTILQRLAGGPPPRAGSNEEEWRELLELPIQAVEDYLAWGVLESEEGRFDFSYPLANLERARRHGLRYIVYPWVHVVPPWYLQSGAFVGFRCLEHDRECGWPSIFAPQTLELYRRFYGAIHREFGGGINALCVAIPADYGEVAYPTGIADWVAKIFPPLDHLHDGYWCGDAFARKRFFERTGREIQIPRIGDPEPQALEFAEFYLRSMAEFVDQVLGLAREIFPALPLHVKLGHGGELLRFGIEPTLIVQAARRHGATMRTTQATLPELHQKRLSTPCRFYGVPFATEPPSDIGREKILERIFCDAANGAQEYFDYPEHLRGSRDLLERYGPLMNGELPQIDVGVLFASSDQRLSTEQGLPPVLVDLAEEMRDRLDYELFDEPMLADGALAGCEVLAWLEGARMRTETLDRILEWVKWGGWLVVNPEVEAASIHHELGRLLSRAPDAGECVALSGEPRASMTVRMGVQSDTLLLSGAWHRREGASPFRGTIPMGEWARWSEQRSSVLFPVRRGVSYLLELDGWVHPLTVQRRHELFVDSERIGRLTRPGLQRYATWISSECIGTRDVLEVAIESETFRSQELLGGDDSRPLGVAVMWMRLTEEGEPALAGEGAALPVLRGSVPAKAFEDRALLRVGEGALVHCRRRPQVVYLSLLEHAARQRSKKQQVLWNSGLRGTAFRNKLLYWNRSREPALIRVSPGESLTIPPGSLAGIPRASLPSNHEIVK